jgi:transcription elongation factor Elf1
MDFSCLPCNRHFVSKQALEQHQRDSLVHKEPKHSEPHDHHVESKVAQKTQQQDAIVHKEAIRCETGNRHFGSKNALGKHRNDSAVHVKTLHSEIPDGHPGSRETTEKQRQDSPVQERAFHCQTCNRRFSSKTALEKHQQDSPVHKKTFHCTTCNQYFGSNKALGNHRKKCQVHQIPAKSPLDALSGSQRAEPLSRKTRARRPTLDIPSLIIKRHTWVLDTMNPVTIAALLEFLSVNHLNPKQETREFFMFPELHQNVSRAVFPEISSTWFQGDLNDGDFHEEYPTCVMGIFVCNTKTCKAQLWVSRTVPIEIRGYDSDGYNVVVYNQRCKSCNGLGNFVLDEDSYVERVAYRLKKWAGVVMALPYYDEKKGRPHERDFCEGCKRGKCQEGDRSAFY